MREARLLDDGVELVDRIRAAGVPRVSVEPVEGPGWMRADQIALGLPEQILCRPDCAGLCPVCGKDLNVDPHEHADLELDPRWAVLEELRDRL